MFRRAPFFEARMILQKPDLEKRLRWHVSRAFSVDIATAVIGDASSKLLRGLAHYPRRDGTNIRVIVGTMSQRGSSEEDRRRAIRSLACQGVNIREHNSRFHPKAYIFRHRDGTHAWVGSNNLTASAFSDNDELALETSIRVVNGCSRSAVPPAASSRYAAPPLRFGPAGDPEGSTARRLAMTGRLLPVISDRLLRAVKFLGRRRRTTADPD